MPLVFVDRWMDGLVDGWVCVVVVVVKCDMTGVCLLGMGWDGMGWDGMGWGMLI